MGYNFVERDLQDNCIVEVTRGNKKEKVKC